MTFDKYKDKYIPQYVFPKDGYDYDYVWTKEIGWHYVRGKKLKETKI